MRLTKQYASPAKLSSIIRARYLHMVRRQLRNGPFLAAFDAGIDVLTLSV